MSLEISGNSSLWSAESYFKSIAKDLVGEPAKKIISCRICAPNGKGVNYSSIIHRIEVKYLDNNCDESIARFIVKILPSGERGKFIEKHDIFNHEIHVYKKILPQTTLLLSQTGSLAKLAPDCVTVLTEPCAIVLEDLSFTHYEMLNRREGLNLEHTIDILTNIAKFHAASVKIYENDPESIERLIGTSIADCINSFSVFFKVGMKSLHDEITQWDGFHDIAEKLDNLTDNFIDKTFENYAKRPTFCVLNHNDLWTNNFMFKYNSDGKLLDTVILDYQFVYWGSPAIDLNFFLFTSVESHVRKTYWNFLIHHYHKTLSKTLKDLNVTCAIPKVADIHIELFKKGSHAVYASLLTAGVVLAPPDTVDFGLLLAESSEGSSYRKLMFSNPKYVEFIKPVLKEFYWLGFLD